MQDHGSFKGSPTEGQCNCSVYVKRRLPLLVHFVSLYKTDLLDFYNDSKYLQQVLINYNAVSCRQAASYCVSPPEPCILFHYQYIHVVIISHHMILLVSQELKSIPVFTLV